MNPRLPMTPFFCSLVHIINSCGRPRSKSSRSRAGEPGKPRSKGSRSSERKKQSVNKSEVPKDPEGNITTSPKQPRNFIQSAFFILIRTWCSVQARLETRLPTITCFYVTQEPRNCCVWFCFFRFCFTHSCF